MFLKIKRIKKEGVDTFSIIFEKPKEMNFYSAQYLNLYLDKDERIFTNSSSPTENFLMITTRKGNSNFKKKLLNLGPGDSLVSDHPAGTYTLDTKTPAVMLAGGIGITPMRSMIKFAVDKKLSIPITLIYSNSNSNFIFKKELDLWQKQYPKLTIHYVVTSKDGHLDNQKLQELLTSHFKSPTSHLPALPAGRPFLTSIHYLAGPPSMVDNFEQILLNLGVDSVNIRTDRFDGY